MPTPRFLRRWLRLPSRVALILGLGTLPTVGAQADAPDQSSFGSFGDISIRSEGGKIYLSEGGLETELQLSATPQRDHLLRLLEGHGPAGVTLDQGHRLLMSSGGGSGFYWWRTKQPGADKQAVPKDPPQVTPPSSLPEQRLAPPGQTPAADKKG